MRPAQGGLNALCDVLCSKSFSLEMFCKVFSRRLFSIEPIEMLRIAEQTARIFKSILLFIQDSVIFHVKAQEMRQA